MNLRAFIKSLAGIFAIAAIPNAEPKFTEREWRKMDEERRAEDQKLMRMKMIAGVPGISWEDARRYVLGGKLSIDARIAFREFIGTPGYSTLYTREKCPDISTWKMDVMEHQLAEFRKMESAFLFPTRFDYREYPYS